MITTAERQPSFAERMLSLPQSPINARFSVVDHKIVEIEGEKRDRVCILAAGMTRRCTEALAVMDDPRYEVWSINAVPPIDAHGRFRSDRHFDLHQRCAQNDDDMRWITETPVPIYVPEDLIGYGMNTVRFPLLEIGMKYGGYWACTFAYQIALALYEGKTEIAMFGVELFSGDERERTVEWACTSWWMGFAEAKGMRFRLPSGSRLGQHPHAYGFEYHDEKAEVEQFVRLMRFGDTIRSYARQRDEIKAHMQDGDRLVMDRETLRMLGVD